MPISPALDEDHLEGDGICLHIVLLLFLTLALYLTCKGQQLRGHWGKQGKDTATPPLIPAPSLVKVGLVGPPRDQIQSNCCFALLSAYALSPIASQ